MTENEKQTATEDVVGRQLGKFDTADELLSAYNALESEFTKRCQLIKQLQAELSLLRAQADTAGGNEDGGTRLAPPEEDGEPQTGGEDTTDARHEKPTAEGEPYVVMDAPLPAPSAPVSDDILLCAAEYANILSGVPEIMTACITKYKQKLIESRGSGSPAGMAVIVPAKRPVTLADAKRLADEMLAKNG